MSELYYEHDWDKMQFPPCDGVHVAVFVRFINNVVNSENI